MGMFLTVISLVVISMFFATKVLTIFFKHEVDIMSTLKENAISQDQKFTAKDGFFVAAALTKFDNEKESIEDWTYGELVFSNFGWGYEDGISAKRAPLNYHPCSDQELGLVKDDN